MNNLFKKTSLLLIVAFLGFGVAKAQPEIFIGAKGGLNIPKLTASGNNPMSKGYSSSLSGNAGLFAEFRFNDLFSIRPAIEYTQEGGRRNGMQAIPTTMLPPDLSAVTALTGGDYLYANFKSKTKFNYLMVPVLANFGWNIEHTPIRLYVNAGPFVSFLLSAKQEMNGSSSLYVDASGNTTLDAVLAGAGYPIQPGVQSMDREQTITDDVHKVNYGVAANIGAAYEVAPRHNIHLEVGGNYGFKKLQKSKENGQNRIGVLTIVLGYSYQL